MYGCRGNHGVELCRTSWPSHLHPWSNDRSLRSNTQVHLSEFSCLNYGCESWRLPHQTIGGSHPETVDLTWGKTQSSSRTTLHTSSHAPGKDFLPTVGALLSRRLTRAPVVHCRAERSVANLVPWKSAVPLKLCGYSEHIVTLVTVLPMKPTPVVRSNASRSKDPHPS